MREVGRAAYVVWKTKKGQDESEVGGWILSMIKLYVAHPNFDTDVNISCCHPSQRSDHMGHGFYDQRTGLLRRTCEHTW